MSQRAEEQFSQYDFESDERWKRFKENSVTRESEEHLKRVYFRRYVNSELPIRTAENSSTSDRVTRPSASHSPNTTTNRGERLGNKLQELITRLLSHPRLEPIRRRLTFSSFQDAIRLVLFFTQLMTIRKAISFFIQSDEASYLSAFQYALISNIISLVAIVGLPSMTSQWFQRLILQEDFAFILFCFVQRSIIPPGQVSLIPIECRTLIAISEYLSTSLPSLVPNLYQNIAGIFQFISRNRDNIYLLGAITEILLFPVMVFKSFQFPRNLMSLLPYSFFLRLRFNFSSYSQLAWRIVDNRLEMVVQNYVPLHCRPHYYRVKHFIKGLSRLR
eukprot:jgi/Galph1/1867/GphlegSOOS_G525.1